MPYSAYCLQTSAILGPVILKFPAGIGILKFFEIFFPQDKSSLMIQEVSSVNFGQLEVEESLDNWIL